MRVVNTAGVTGGASGELSFTESLGWGVGKSALVGAIAGLLLPVEGTITLAGGGVPADAFVRLEGRGNRSDRNVTNANQANRLARAALYQGDWRRANAFVDDQRRSSGSERARARPARFTPRTTLPGGAGSPVPDSG